MRNLARTVVVSGLLMSAMVVRPVGLPTAPVSLAAQDESVFFCPMHSEVTATVRGQCPICRMTLVAGNPRDVKEYSLEFSTLPRAVKPGEPFKMLLAVRHPRTSEVIASFEEIHDKRFHLFIVSQDLSVFEHVHPEQQPDGTWQLEARLPKAGYYRIFSDFMPTGGAPQFIARPLITANFTGDAESAPPRLEPDTTWTKTVDSITATVEVDPTPPVPGEHGHLRFTLKDAVTGQPVNDLQPYLGAFGHTFMLGEQTPDAIHSHPTEGPDSDISRGLGGPRVSFEGYFPVAGNYRAWTQFLRNGTLTTFSFTFRVPSPEEAAQQR